MKINLFVEQSAAGTRIDKYLSQKFPNLSRSKIEKLLTSKLIRVNDNCIKKSYRVETNDHIIGHYEENSEKIEAENLDLTILYDDPYLAIVHKDRNCIIHPNTHIRNNTFVNGLLYEFKKLSTIGGEDRPGIVHRLDKDTTGLVIVAKDDRTHRLLKKLFQSRNITKKYICICHGNTSNHFIVDTPIGRDPHNPIRMATLEDGKTALTKCTKIDSNKEYTLLKIDLITGRTHQIRVHLSSIHHPILGDPIYGRKKEKIKAEYPLLHSYFLEFIHPINGKKIRVIDEIDQYFSEYILKAGLNIPDNFFNGQK